MTPQASSLYKESGQPGRRFSKNLSFWRNSEICRMFERCPLSGRTLCVSFVWLWWFRVYQRSKAQDVCEREKLSRFPPTNTRCSTFPFETCQLSGICLEPSSNCWTQSTNSEWLWMIPGIGKLKPVLMALEPVPKSCKELVSCSCKAGCSPNRCGCLKNGLRHCTMWRTMPRGS